MKNTNNTNSNINKSNMSNENTKQSTQAAIFAEMLKLASPEYRSQLFNNVDCFKGLGL